MRARAVAAELPVSRAARGRHLPPAAGAADVLELQRLAGNAATARLLAGGAVSAQRHALAAASPVDLAGGEMPAVTGAQKADCTPKTSEVKPSRPTPADAELSDGQVTGAIAFYRSLRDRYTPDVMRELQGAVGAVTTGVPDAETVRAVAKAQVAEGGEPPLLPDGKAGPRTLPRLFRAGLNTAASQQKFAEGSTAVAGEWTALGTPAAKAGRMLDANDRLQGAKVRPLQIFLKDLEGCAVGQLNIAQWGMDLVRGSFDGATITDKRAKEVAHTVYHEARHGQQWFEMARFLAGQGFGIGGISSALGGMDRDAATDAHARPLPSGSAESVIAQNWFESFYGEGSDYEQRVAEANAAIQALKRAEKAFEDNPTEANRRRVEAAARRRDFAMQRRYRDHPVEDDAFATGNAMTAVM